MEKSLIKTQQLNLENIEQIEVVRSFSKKIQLKQFEPIDIFASYKAVVKQGTSPEEIDAISQDLHRQAVKDVEFDINNQFKANNNPF